MVLPRLRFRQAALRLSLSYRRPAWSPIRPDGRCCARSAIEVESRDKFRGRERFRNELECSRAEVAHRQLVVDIAGTDDDASVWSGHEVVVDQLTRASARHDAVSHEDVEFAPRSLTTTRPASTSPTSTTRWPACLSARARVVRTSAIVFGEQDGLPDGCLEGARPRGRLTVRYIRQRREEQFHRCALARLALDVDRTAQPAERRRIQWTARDRSRVCPSS